MRDAGDGEKDKLAEKFRLRIASSGVDAPVKEDLLSLVAEFDSSTSAPAQADNTSKRVKRRSNDESDEDEDSDADERDGAAKVADNPAAATDPAVAEPL